MQRWQTERILEQNAGLNAVAMWRTDKLVTGDAVNISVYNVGTWVLKLAWNDHLSWVTAFAVSPHDPLIFCSYACIKVWSSSTCSLYQILPAGASYDKGAEDMALITVWDAQTWTQVTTLSCSDMGAHPDCGVCSLARCGRLVLSVAPMAMVMR
jgi:WD40 repeat protein